MLSGTSSGKFSHCLDQPLQQFSLLAARFSSLLPLYQRLYRCRSAIAWTIYSVFHGFLTFTVATHEAASIIPWPRRPSLSSTNDEESYPLLFLLAFNVLYLLWFRGYNLWYNGVRPLFAKFHLSQFCIF